MQILTGILQTQTRLLEGMAQSGGLSYNVRGGQKSGVVGNWAIVTLKQFKKLRPLVF